MAMSISPAEIAQYEEDGFLLVKGIVDPSDVEALGIRLREYTHGNRPQNALQVQIEPRIQREELSVMHQGDGIRKIDGLVEGDDLFQGLGLHPNIRGILTQILGPDFKMFRNALLLKPPTVGSAKGMHQDSPYWPIEPMSLCSCWFPLDDATLENGCMAVLQGEHKRGPLPHVHVQDDFVVDEDSYDSAKIEMLPMKAGDGLFFHSLLPHYTAPNVSANWRRAIALSYMSAQSQYKGEGGGPVFFPVQGQSFPGCVR